MSRSSFSNHRGGASGAAPVSSESGVAGRSGRRSGCGSLRARNHYTLDVSEVESADRTFLEHVVACLAVDTVSQWARMQVGVLAEHIFEVVLECLDALDLELDVVGA